MGQITHTQDSGAEFSYPVIRPKPAGTLLILDEVNRRPHVLMGRRHNAHTFMPDVFVFPGGRVDFPDNYAPFAKDLTPGTAARLIASGPRNVATMKRVRAFALAAIRETFEEAGILIGQQMDPEKKTDKKTRNALWKPFFDHGQIPDLSAMRYVARATTPAKLVRRYDTRFFTVTRDAISLELSESPTNELSELTWVPLDDISHLKIPWITSMVLKDVAIRVADINSIYLSDDQPVPIYASRRGKRSRTLI
ncbi:MAG: NUDIX hydrolase [Hyphomicrobiales bacterium]